VNVVEPLPISPALSVAVARWFLLDLRWLGRECTRALALRGVSMVFQTKWFVRLALEELGHSAREPRKVSFVSCPDQT